MQKNLFSERKGKKESLSRIARRFLRFVCLLRFFGRGAAPAHAQNRTHGMNDIS